MFTEVRPLIEALHKAQGINKDIRDRGRKAIDFTSHPAGQWEPNLYKSWKSAGRPRYTFDRVTPIRDLIVGELEQNEFAATVSPGDGASSKDGADLRDSMLRTIQNKSKAHLLYKKIASRMFDAGFDCLRVKSDYKNGDSFDQELDIDYLSNSIDRVWFDPNSQTQTHEDAEWCVVLTGMGDDSLKKEFPKHKEKFVSISESRNTSSYYDKREVTVIGEFIYKTYDEREIVLLNTGQVTLASDFDERKEELAAINITEEKRRKRMVCNVKTRYFDGQNWLSEEQDTPFDYLPVIPFYHCFQVVDDKVIYRIPVEKMMDAQRVLNYAESRMISDGALAPVEKYWATTEQTKGHENEIGTMNTNNHPLQHYNHVDNQPPPFKQGGPTVNQSLLNTSQGAKENIEAISGMYAANMAKNPQNQSGKALGIQMDKGDTGNVSLFSDMEVGITHLCRVLVNALPTVYDTKQEYSVVRADGQREDLVLNDFDGEQEVNKIDDGGTYELICEMGPMFKNRLDKGTDAMLQVAQVMPEIMQGGADIFLRGIDAPNMDKLADRSRAQLLAAGMIPQDQLTEDELQEQQMAAQQDEQNGQPDAMTIAAMAEDKKAMAELENARTSQAEAQIDMFNAETKRLEAMVKAQEAGVKIEGMNIDNQLKAFDAADKKATIQGKQLDNEAKAGEAQIKGMSTEDLIRMAGQ